MKSFPAPGVNTLITYGYEVNTPASYEWAVNFTGQMTQDPGPPSKTVVGDGDSIVPLRSSQRALFDWTDEQAKLKKQLVSKAYKGQVHAHCAIPGEPTGCYTDVLELFTKGVVPKAFNPPLKTETFVETDELRAQREALWRQGR